MFKDIPCGDSALIIKTGDDISVKTNMAVRKLLLRFENKNLDGIVDFIPSYNELMICYDPTIISYDILLFNLRILEADLDNTELAESSVIHLPVLYGGEAGPDLHEVAAFNGLSEDEVIKIHCSESYYVYMLGFTPGFCYLGGMDERIAIPRKKTPRLAIPAGAVGIADKQTGIYPIESPGGWQLIGKTPLKLFNPAGKPEFLIRAGDFIRFISVTDEEYQDILNKVENGLYETIKSKIV
jgi:inhibitor of KinA